MSQSSTMRASFVRRALAFTLAFVFGQTTGMVGGCGFSDSHASAPRSVAYVTRTMGTYGRVAIVTADSAATAPLARAAQAAFARVDSLMSNWTQTSEVARINRVAGTETTEIQPEVAAVIDAALAMWQSSDGAFDMTVEPLVRAWGFLGGPRRVPSQAAIDSALALVGAQQVHFDREHHTLRFDRDGVRIDLGGIAKGYAVDVAAESLHAHGVPDALVDISGNMRALGRPPGADGWRIGIRDPRDRMPYFARLRLKGGGISTSGQYEQFIAANGKTYGHILNPRTGWPVDSLISVTVVSPTALECDAWDTPLFVLGPHEARRMAKSHDDLSVVLVEPGRDGVDTVWVEESLRDRFTLEPAARALFRVKYF